VATAQEIASPPHSSVDIVATTLTPASAATVWCKGQSIIEQIGRFSQLL